MSSITRQLLDVVSSLANDCTMEDFGNHLYVRPCIDEGMQARKEGRVYSHEELRYMMNAWRKSY